jgi:hypothetical protein
MIQINAELAEFGIAEGLVLFLQNKKTENKEDAANNLTNARQRCATNQFTSLFLIGYVPFYASPFMLTWRPRNQQP